MPRGTHRLSHEDLMPQTAWVTRSRHLRTTARHPSANPVEVQVPHPYIQIQPDPRTNGKAMHAPDAEQPPALSLDELRERTLVASDRKTSRRVTRLVRVVCGGADRGAEFVPATRRWRVVSVRLLRPVEALERLE